MQLRKLLEMIKKRGDRPKFTQIARTAGVSRSTFYKWLDKTATPSFDELERISLRYNADLKKLCEAAGIEYRQLTENTQNVYIEEEKAGATQNYEISDLLEITQNILASKTVYRKDLESNIIAFGVGVEQEGKVERLEERLERVESLLLEIRKSQKDPGYEKKSKLAS